MWNAVYSRRKGIVKTAGTIGGVYVASRFISQRLDDMRQSVVQEKVARETLRRRYQQTQEDISYTVLALLPTLAEQILMDMDVERLTTELQNMSKSKRQQLLSPQLAIEGPSHSEFLIPQNMPRSGDDEARSEASVGSTSTSDLQVVDPNSPSSTSHLSYSTTSWVENMSDASSVPESRSPLVGSELNLSDSVTSMGSGVTSASALSGSSVSSGKTKAELWKELKVLSISRALTSVYTVTLLTLLTTVQLSQLARRRYVTAICTMEQEERRHSAFSIASLFWPGFSDFSMDDFFDGDKTWEDTEVDQDTEHMFLTLSWWVLHVGWKELSQTVLTAVKDVFMGVSLKTPLMSADIKRLLNDVRRAVERDGSHTKNFIDLIIPVNDAQTRLTLANGGVLPVNEPDSADDDLERWFLSQPQPPSSSLMLDMVPYSAPLPPVFTSLHRETLRTLASPEFDRVLDSLLESALDTLLEDINEMFPEPQEEGAAAELRLAELLPGFTSWSQTNLNSLPNRVVDRMLAQPEISSLSAIVFGRFQDDMSNS
ncbi:Peroxin-3 [Pterulicium gracile]|uniref:Peroxin-3 n=1 Tax=Pterulicium gracile TaxID=1884261 RepID=A0A5C3R081_9AGAR|nr:Peroxin-3 [Pterula gracilis]